MLCVSCSHPRIMPTRAMATQICTTTRTTITRQTDILFTRQMVTFIHHHLPNLINRQLPLNQRRQFLSLVYPLFLYRMENSKLGTLVPVSPLEHLNLFRCLLYSQFDLKVHIALIHQSRPWAMVLLEQSCCVIGMGRYRPIHHSLLCNAVAALDQNGLESVSSPSRG
jgi:hypothetical protein